MLKHLVLVLAILLSGAALIAAEESLEELKSLATDPQSTAEEKLYALQALRGQLDQLGNDARDHDVVRAMIDLVQSSDDAKVRADVYRHLSGIADPALFDPLLNSLANDPSATVREEAAEILKAFRSAPMVQDALHFSAENDKDLGVREQAQKSLTQTQR